MRPDGRGTATESTRIVAAKALKRTGRDRFLRNVLIAIGNSGDTSLVVEAERLLDDASPLVRGAAVWALSRLMPAEHFAALARDHRSRESEPFVAAEWTAALEATAA